MSARCVKIQEIQHKALNIKQMAHFQDGVTPVCVCVCVCVRPTLPASHTHLTPRGVTCLSRSASAGVSPSRRTAEFQPSPSSPFLPPPPPLPPPPYPGRAWSEKEKVENGRVKSM